MRLISNKGFGFFVIYRVLLGLAILAGLHFGFIQ
jgi:undecaprenyl-diphosphatase